MKYFVLVAAVLLITIRACVCSSGSAPEQAAVQSTAPAAAADPYDGRDLDVYASRLIRVLKRRENGEFQFKDETGVNAATVDGKSSVTGSSITLRSAGDRVQAIEILIPNRDSGPRMIAAVEMTGRVLEETFVEYVEALEIVKSCMDNARSDDQSSAVLEAKKIGVKAFPLTQMFLITIEPAPVVETKAETEPERGPV